MILQRKNLSYLNKFIRKINLRLETLTVENLESTRFADLERRAYFSRPVFPQLSGFRSMGEMPLLEELTAYGHVFDTFVAASSNSVGYTFNNDWFSSPDAEVLYVMVRSHEPNTIIEIGSGHSTKIFRQAILDGNLDTHLISVDPKPRAYINDYVDELHLMPAEVAYETELFSSLATGDILFIDSSHTVKPANDVLTLFLNVIPSLPSGTVIHIHDIFLPYDYPLSLQRRGWTEQYIVQAMLEDNKTFDILWAGHFLQRTREDFSKHFPHLGKGSNGLASSLWLRKTSSSQ